MSAALGRLCGKNLWSWVSDAHTDPQNAAHQLSEELKRTGILKKTFVEMIVELQRGGMLNDVTPFLRGWSRCSEPVFLCGTAVDHGAVDHVKELDFYLTVGVCGDANRYFASTSTPQQGFFRVQLNHRAEVPGLLVQALCDRDDDNLFLSPTKLLNYVEHVFLTNVNLESAKVRRRRSGTDNISIEIDFELGTLVLNVIPCFSCDLLTRDCEHIHNLSETQKSLLFISPLKLVPSPAVGDRLRFQAVHALAERKLMSWCSETDKMVLKRCHKRWLLLLNRSVQYYHLKTCLWQIMRTTREWNTFDIRRKSELVEEKFLSCLKEGELQNIFNIFVNLFQHLSSTDCQQLHDKFKDPHPHPPKSEELAMTTKEEEEEEEEEDEEEEEKDDKFWNSLAERVEILEKISAKRVFQNESWTAELRNCHSASAMLKNALVLGHRELAMEALACDEDQSMPNNGSFVVAAEHRQLELLKMLAFRGADLNKPDAGFTALHITCKLGYRSAVKLLLELGAYPDVESQSAETPLLQACRNNFPKIAKLLLQRGALPDLMAKNKLTPLMISAQNGFTKVAKVLLRYRAKVNFQQQKSGNTAAHFAAKCGYFDSVELLVSSGADVNLLNHRKESCLHLAAEKGHLEMVKFLCQQKVQLGRTSASGLTELGAAARANQLSVLQFLQQRGVPVHVDAAPTQALCEAAARGHADTCEHLLQHGAKVNFQRDKDKRTALHLAISGNHTSVVGALLLWNANPLLKDKKEQRSVDVICTVAVGDGQVTDSNIRMLLATHLKSKEKEIGDKNSNISQKISAALKTLKKLESSI